jgi:hypothetical protein
MPRMKSGGVACLAAMLALTPPGAATAAAQASSKVPATIDFEADLAHVAAAAHGALKAGGTSWSCSTTHCTGKGPGNDPAATCKALVQQVGALKNFVAGGRAIDMKTCGAQPAAMTAAPMKVATIQAAPVVRPPVPLPTQKGAPTPAAAPAATPAPAKKGAAPATGGVAITTQTFTLTGTGVAPPRAAFTPLAWTAAAMNLTGTGAAPPAHPWTPISFTADTIRLTGRP